MVYEGSSWALERVSWNQGFSRVLMLKILVDLMKLPYCEGQRSEGLREQGNTTSWLSSFQDRP